MDREKMKLKKRNGKRVKIPPWGDKGGSKSYLCDVLGEINIV